MKKKDPPHRNRWKNWPPLPKMFNLYINKAILLRLFFILYSKYILPVVKFILLHQLINFIIVYMYALLYTVYILIFIWNTVNNLVWYVVYENAQHIYLFQELQDTYLSFATIQRVDLGIQICCTYMMHSLSYGQGCKDSRYWYILSNVAI